MHAAYMLTQTCLILHPVSEGVYMLCFAAISCNAAAEGKLGFEPTHPSS